LSALKTNEMSGNRQAALPAVSISRAVAAYRDSLPDLGAVSLYSSASRGNINVLINLVWNPVNCGYRADQPNAGSFRLVLKSVAEEFAMSNILMKTTQGIAIASLMACAVLAQPARAQQTGIKRTDLQRHDLSASGREAVQVRVDIEPGVAFPRHTHPGEEIIYVLAGSLEYDVEGRPPVTLKAGDVLFVPAGMVHAAKNVGSDTASELATYIVEKGKPLVTLAK
jgi:quercetin dioxygenase-like cupin family protein